MKSFILTLLFQIALLSSFAQTDEIVSMGSGYANQSFYSLENGEVSNVSNTDWDIAFMSDAFNSSILVNDNIGTSLYLYGGNVANWNAVDTTGMIWTPLYNSETKWEEGAFIQLASETDPFDYGWGSYNIITHLVTGNKIFILELGDGSFKKVVIESLDLGTYSFKYADLDGENEVNESISGSDYSEKNFWYYSIQDEMVIDREPVSESWDITFTRYTSEIFPGANYTVAGALQNIGLQASEARGVEVDDALWTDYAFEDDINIIGSDWKFFNMAIFEYVIEDSLSYFVQDQTGNVWHLIFTDFGGSATGNISFTKEMVSATGLDEDFAVDFAVFPNPASEQLNVVVPVEAEPVMARIIDMRGAVVALESWNSGIQHNINVSGIPAGFYLLEVEVNGRLGHERLVIN